jgi:hypothetical protein
MLRDLCRVKTVTRATRKKQSSVLDFVSERWFAVSHG